MKPGEQCLAVFLDDNLPLKAMFAHQKGLLASLEMALDLQATYSYLFDPTPQTINQQVPTNLPCGLGDFQGHGDIPYPWPPGNFGFLIGKIRGLSKKIIKNKSYLPSEPALLNGKVGN